MKNFSFRNMLPLLLLLCCNVAAAHDFKAGGIYYNITDAENLTVEVTYKGDNIGLDRNDYVNTVVIPSAVTHNGTEYSVTGIGKEAFCYCLSLTGVSIPNSVTSIGEKAFAYCAELSRVKIPESVTDVGENAFSYTSWYESIPDGMVYIGKVLLGYKGLMLGDTHVEVKEGTVKIADHAFWNRENINSVSLPGSLVTIGNNAFNGCTYLVGVEIPATVTVVGEKAFANCSYLTSATIDGAASIGKEAFWNCGRLASITLKGGVTSVGEMAFYGCEKLDAVHISDVSAWCSADFGENSNPLCYAKNLYLNGEMVTGLVIPDDVTAIKENVFCGCTSIESVTIGKGVKSIAGSAFDGCRNIRKIVYECPAIEAGWFACKSSVSETVIADGVTAIADRAFEDYTALRCVTLPGSVTSVGNLAFGNCTGLEEVVIGDGVTRIGEKAFSGCTSLARITMGRNVSDVGALAFEKCPRLSAVYVADMAAWCNVNFANDANPLSCAKKLYLDGRLVTDLVIPQGVTEIRNGVFHNCDCLTSVKFSDSVTSIGEDAFSNCINLAGVTIGRGVASIGNNAFGNCSKLSTINISDLAAWCSVDFSNGNCFDYLQYLRLNGKKVSERKLRKACDRK